MSNRQTSDGLGSVFKDGGYLHRHRVTAFFALTLVLSWGWWYGSTAAFGHGTPSTVQVLVGGFGPVVAALVVGTATGDRDEWVERLRYWRVAPRWYAVALFLPPPLLAGGVGLYLAVGAPIDASLLPKMVPAYPLLVVFLALVGGGQEELGWRGYALPHLQRRYSPFTASLVIGAVWALWHYPLFSLGHAPNASGNVPVYVAMVLAFSVLFTWAFDASGGSVPLLVLLHGGVNASGSLFPVAPDLVAEWGLTADVAIAAASWLVVSAVLAIVGTNLGCETADDGRTENDRLTVTSELL